MTPLREHVLDLFRPHPKEKLEVLKDVGLRAQAKGSARPHGAQRLRQEHLAEDRVGYLPAGQWTGDCAAPITPILELGVGWNPDLDAVDNIYLLGSVMGMTLREVKRAMEEILAFADLEVRQSRAAALLERHGCRLAYSVAFHAVRKC